MPLHQRRLYRRRCTFGHADMQESAAWHLGQAPLASRDRRIGQASPPSNKIPLFKSAKPGYWRSFMRGLQPWRSPALTYGEIKWLEKFLIFKPRNARGQARAPLAQPVVRVWFRVSCLVAIKSRWRSTFRSTHCSSA
ncbi:hypothetical protein RV134_340191 [Roseovarius sp. EC-HK134]|nr:hypothetical protein RV134_340191 [Roseovarius sp. EC-HK134]VVT26817.1 hypothetical protein RV420_400192 [Roseovarius sp. EC-SD190]